MGFRNLGVSFANRFGLGICVSLLRAACFLNSIFHFCLVLCFGLEDVSGRTGITTTTAAGMIISLLLLFLQYSVLYLRLVNYHHLRSSVDIGWTGEVRSPVRDSGVKGRVHVINGDLWPGLPHVRPWWFCLLRRPFLPAFQSGRQLALNR